MPRCLPLTFARALLVLGAVGAPNQMRAQRSVRAGFFAVDPRATFLFEPAVNASTDPTIIDLAGVADGTVLRLRPSGKLEWLASQPVADMRSSPRPFIGIFSSTNTVLPIGAMGTRVPGAVPSEFGDYTTLPSLPNTPFDFLISGDFLRVRKPAGARYLVVGLNDDFMADNSAVGQRPFGLFVRTTTPEPATLALTGAGLLAASGVKRRRDRRSPG